MRQNCPSYGSQEAERERERERERGEEEGHASVTYFLHPDRPYVLISLPLHKGIIFLNLSRDSSVDGQNLHNSTTSQ
jgi:hypothetical protein